MMPAIYVDLDDVLAQTGRMLLRVLDAEFGRQVAFNSIRSYHLGESLSLDEAELERFLRAAHEPERLLSVEPMAGAAEVLSDWRARGFEVLIVTGRPPETREITLEWLRKSAIPYSGFHFLDKYSAFYDGAHGTADGCLGLDDLEALDLCFAVEDFPGMTEHLARSLALPVALFDRPWNAELGDGDGRIHRCRDWREIRDRFDRLVISSSIRR